MDVELTIEGKSAAKRFRGHCNECGEAGMIACCICGCPICETCQNSSKHAEPCSCITAREEEEFILDQIDEVRAEAFLADLDWPDGEP